MRDPFFIIGSGRCGSTLLRRILCAHPRVFIPPEYGYLREVVRAYSQQAYRPWPRLVSGVLEWYAWERSWQPLMAKVRGPVQGALESEVDERRSLARIIEAVYWALADSMGKPDACWGDKTPANTFLLTELNAVFPRARYVHLLRDGIDVVASFMEKDQSGDIAAYALRWRDAATRARAMVEAHPQRAIELRYEDLVRDASQAVKPVFELLGLDWNSALANDLSRVDELIDVGEYGHHANVRQPVSDSFVGKGRRTLSTAQLQVLDALIRHDLQRFGYAPAQA